MANGILIIDKPTDWTSHDVVAKLRGILHEKRIGHAGTLDPMATGVLPVFVGRATRAVEFAAEREKEYLAGLRLGQVTDTQDVTGSTLSTAPVSVTREDVEKILAQFRGDIRQIPPMYSAIKKEGKKLYELARRGQEVERQPRPITIYELELLDQLSPTDYTLRVKCSKGTYVRTLCHDIGQALGCGGTLFSLRRTRSAGFALGQAVTLEQVQAAADPAALLLPDAVNSYLSDHNIQLVREIQREIHDYYAADASKYDEEKKLKIRRIYDLIPSNMENKKKRVVAKRIEGKKGKRFGDYQDEFDYLVSAGIALNVRAISTPVFPLLESSGKNLLKLYLNDVGILTGLLYGNNIRAVLSDQTSVNLGSVYESVVASELIAHGYQLFYYDNRTKGEVDYLIDDYESLSAVPIEVKSGKDYTVHSALNTFVQNEDYHIKKAFVVSNERKVTTQGKVTYLPIYDIMFFQNAPADEKDLYF